MTASSPVARAIVFIGGAGNHGEGRKRRATGKSCFQDGGDFHSGFSWISKSGPRGFYWKKIICPEASCLKEKLFFERKGLGHHFRTIHKKEANAKVVSKAVIKTWELYGQETLEYIAVLSEWKSKVSICIIYVLIFGGTVVMQMRSTGFPVPGFLNA